MKIGFIIGSTRKQHKLSQAELARKSGISSTYLSRIETSKDEPTLTTLQRISDALGLPLPVLFFYSIEESDVPENKKDLFRVIGPSLNSFLKEIFKVEDEPSKTDSK